VGRRLSTGVAFTYLLVAGHSCRTNIAELLRHPAGRWLCRIQQVDRTRQDWPGYSACLCWAHARRKLVEIIRNGSAPIAEDGLKRIGELYRTEAELRGLDQTARLAGDKNCQRH